jgi:hypothetical protein
MLSLSDEELLAEMASAHASHQNGPCRRSPRRSAESARNQLGAHRRSTRYDPPIGLGTILRRGIENSAYLGCFGLTGRDEEGFRRIIATTSLKTTQLRRSAAQA